MEARHTDLREMFSLLESRELQVVDSVKALIQENLASIREPWLVTNLVEFYFSSHSKAAKDLLCSVSEPHDKPVLEKICEGIRSQEHALSALQLLLHIVCKHPSWLPRLVTNVPVFKNVLKCLKSETNIQVLMTAVTIVTILLPSVPNLIGPYLPEIAEIFHRLASFGVKRPAINAPDIFFLHLQVAVYALFHRMYGMFPYNFLAYLRHYYTKKENAVVFEEVVKCMLERVRVHPLLITGTKDSEISSTRWRKMETNDIVVQCANMSLDPVEGTWEELHCPIVASRYRQPSVTTRKDTAHSLPPCIQDMVSNSIESCDSAANLEFTSPSEIMGLATPPPTRKETSTIQYSLEPPTLAHPHTTPTVPSLLTPMNTPRETPPVSEDHEKGSSRTSRSHSQQKPELKRLSTELPPIVPMLTPSSQAQSIPPSPLKTEFTNTPPFGVKTLPVINAARELQFDMDQSKTLDRLVAERRSNVTTDGFPSLECSQSQEHSKFPTPKWPSRSGSVTQFEDSLEVSEKVDDAAIAAASGGVAPPFSVSSTKVDDLLSTSVTVTTPDTVSLDSLHQVVQKLDIQDEDNDDEVSELTASSSQERNHTLTAESVAKLMRSVNRIRFNSLTATNIEQIRTKLGPSSRSRSCPQLPRIDLMEEEEEGEERTDVAQSLQSVSHLAANESAPENKATSTVSEARAHSSQTCPRQGTDNQSATVTITSTVETIITSQTKTSVNMTKCPMFEDKKEEEGENSFTVVLKQLLSPLQAGVCSKCRANLEATDDNQKTAVNPFFSSLSPPDLLDKHIQQARDIHAKELSKLPITTNQDVNWTHFGGVPPADEISILRGQLMLMHNHLLYERHKREQHAKRNRRLLRRIAHTNMLEEQNKAMKDQLSQQDRTIRDQTVSIRLLQAENVKLRSSAEANTEESNTKLRECLQENEDLKTAKMEMNMLLIRQREDQESLQQKLQSVQAKLFNTEKELENEQKHATVNVNLKAEVIRQQKELLLMGELQQRTNEKLIEYKTGKAKKYETENLVSGLKSQIGDLKSDVASKKRELASCHQQLAETRQALSVREQGLLELRHHLEMAKASHEEELMSYDEKYQAMLRINQNLEFHVIKLYSEIEELKSAQKSKVSVKPFTASADSEAGTQRFYSDMPPSPEAQQPGTSSQSHDIVSMVTKSNHDITDDASHPLDKISSHRQLLSGEQDNHGNQTMEKAKMTSLMTSQLTSLDGSAVGMEMTHNSQLGADVSGSVLVGCDDTSKPSKGHNTFTDSGLG